MDNQEKIETTKNLPPCIDLYITQKEVKEAIEKKGFYTKCIEWRMMCYNYIVIKRIYGSDFFYITVSGGVENIKFETKCINIKQAFIWANKFHLLIVDLILKYGWPGNEKIKK